MAFKGDGLRSFVGRVLRAFSPESTHRFFESIGVILKLEETGKYFPITDSARTVLNALLQAVKDAGAELRTGVLVQGIERDGNQWRIETSNGVMVCRAVVICTGGLALPKSGSEGAGLNWAKQLGHRIVHTTPALTPLLCEDSPYAHLSGIAVPVRLRFIGEKTTDYEGPLLFTHTGYSGPVALNISRHVAREKGAVKMRLLPDVKDGEEGVFWQAFVKRHSQKIFANALTEYFPRRVAETISLLSIGEFVYHPNVGQLDREQQKAVRAALFNQELKIDKVADYVKAEATSGGVALDEIEPATMMSKLQSGLFLAGEVCDVDGWLGGYNFQWAWSSGTVAGRASARFALK
jgi:predicted Rossmann fold flavoprotein